MTPSLRLEGYITPRQRQWGHPILSRSPRLGQFWPVWLLGSVRRTRPYSRSCDLASSRRVLLPQSCPTPEPPLDPRPRSSRQRSPGSGVIPKHSPSEELL